MVTVKCPACHRFLVLVPRGTPFQGYCKGCGLKWEARA